MIAPVSPIPRIYTSSNERKIYKLTPLFQGIKSSWFNNTALGTSSPLAALIQYSSISSPICSIVLSPSTIGPQSISIISPILLVNAEFVASLIVGQTGLPVGVPNPVVNNIRVAPLAALPVVASTSLPGVHTKLNPGFTTGSV